MNNLEKLTEATMLALQGKLEEKENLDNRVINAQIRQADKNIDDLHKAGLVTTVMLDGDINFDNLDSDEELKKFERATQEVMPVKSQDEYDKLIDAVGKDNVYLYVASSNYEDAPAYSVSEKAVISPDTDDGWGTTPVNKNIDIFNYLKVKGNRIDNETGSYISNAEIYGNDAKNSDDNLKNSPLLRQGVKAKLNSFKQQQVNKNTLEKDIDTLAKNNDDFSKDDEIIQKNKELKNVKKDIKDNSNDDGSFDVNKAREDIKNYYGIDTV